MMHSDTKVTSRLMFRLLPVQILLAAVESLNGIVTSLFAGNSVGSTAMSAIGLYSPVSLLTGALSTILISGSVILAGQYIGKNMPDKTQDCFVTDITFAVLLSAVLMIFHLAAGLFSSGRLFTGDHALWTVFRPYLLGQTLGILPMILGNHLAAFLSLFNRNRRTTAASIVFIAVNVILNYLFLEVMRLEALGLALAASLGQWVFFLIEAAYFFRKDAALHFRLNVPELRESLSVVKIGTPGALSTFYMSFRGLIVNALILSHVGSAGLSAFTAANAFLNLFWTIPSGMRAVSRMLISVSVGEEDRETLVEIMRTVMYRFLPLMCVVAAGIIMMAVPFTRLYFRDPSDPVYRMTVMGFRILPLCMPLSLICMHFTCYWQSSDRMMPVHILGVLDGVVSVSLFTYLLMPHLGMNSVYIANVINGIVTTLFIFGYAVRKKPGIPVRMEELMVIPASFGVPEEERIDLPVRDPQDVVTISEKVQKFCLEAGLDSRRAYFAGLALEEMAGNVIEHGFTKDSRPHSADIRVVHKNDTVILRIRDDCIPFDPAERLAMVDPQDKTKNIGIRMVYRIADDVTYRNIFGLNTLTVRI